MLKRFAVVLLVSISLASISAGSAQARISGMSSLSQTHFPTWSL
jgi:hypothetical protein